MKKLVAALLLLLAFNNSNAQLSWLKMADYPGNGKGGCASFSINGKGYMGLGFDNAVSGFSDWYEYDPGTNTWTVKASLPATGRWTCVNFVIGDKGYVVTGLTTSGYTNQLWEYDPALDTWTQKTSFPGSSRQNATGFSISGKGYLGTGYIGSVSENDFYEYDPINDSWMQKTDFPGVERDGSVGFAIGSKGYIGMGNTTNGLTYPKDLYEYDPSSDTWTPKADFPLPTGINSATVYSSSDNGYILCGIFNQSGNRIASNPGNLLYKYTPSTDSWELEGTFPGMPRAYAGGFSVGNDIYIGGGCQNSNTPVEVQTDVWKLSNGLTLLVSNPDPTQDFSIYPNPTNEWINFGKEINGSQVDFIRIFDVTGKQINTYKLRGTDAPINIGGLSKGIYFVELITIDGKVMDSRFEKL